MAEALLAPAFKFRYSERATKICPIIRSFSDITWLLKTISGRWNKFLWPFQNIWTLSTCSKYFCTQTWYFWRQSVWPPNSTKCDNFRLSSISKVDKRIINVRELVSPIEDVVILNAFQNFAHFVTVMKRWHEKIWLHQFALIRDYIEKSGSKKSCFEQTIF